MFLRNTIDWGLARLAVLQAGQDVGRKAAEYMLQRYLIHAPRDTGFMVSTAAIVGGKSSLQWHVIVTADYAPFVEFGHLAGGTWVPPNPALPQRPRRDNRGVPSDREIGTDSTAGRSWK